MNLGTGQLFGKKQPTAATHPCIFSQHCNEGQQIYAIFPYIFCNIGRRKRQSAIDCSKSTGERRCDSRAGIPSIADFQANPGTFYLLQSSGLAVGI